MRTHPVNTMTTAPSNAEMWIGNHPINAGTKNRIIDAIARRLRKHQVRVFSNVRHYGNTSSTSIPLGLTEILESSPPGEMPRRFGLTAFGGGYTYAGAVLELRTNKSSLP